MRLGPLGGPEIIIIILVIVILIFGPKNLPKLGSAIGRTVKNLRSGMEGDDDDKKKDGEDKGGETAEAAEAEVEDAEAETVEKDEGSGSDKA